MAIEDHLKKYAEGITSLGVRHGTLYSCQEEVVLELGRSWELGREESIPSRGERKLCFMNAFQLAQRYADLTYVEGFAQSVWPMLHAWVIDANGHVIDPTWDYQPEREYFGIAFDIDWVTAHIVETGVYGILGGDFRHAAKFFNEGFPTEAFSKRWMTVGS